MKPHICGSKERAY
ncbi:unnamed protein product [Linum tenue]|uniref:Uncharacterized protein n=1 Tax=Linum tenue TaxID=586396 RepID=A0AAV0P3K6_9ROSI|nr:unnamed protein product [Linum tenue]